MKVQTSHSRRVTLNWSVILKKVNRNLTADDLSLCAWLRTKHWITVQYVLIQILTQPVETGSGCWRYLNDWHKRAVSELLLVPPFAPRKKNSRLTRLPHCCCSVTDSHQRRQVSCCGRFTCMVSIATGSRDRHSRRFCRLRRENPHYCRRQGSKNRVCDKTQGISFD
jgi:hypothetical protein